MHVRRCRACGEEYRPEIATCVECGGPLEDVDDELVPFEARPRAEVAEPSIRKPPEGYVSVHVTREVRDIDAFVERLDAAEIPFHVQDAQGERGHSASTYSVMVPEAQALPARRAIAPLLGMDPEDVEREFDPEQGYGQCPACSSQIPPRAATCPECGLTILGDA